MKAIVTIFFVLFFGLIASAQEQGERKAATIKAGLVQLTEISAPSAVKNEVARLYRRNGSRVKKELNFTTKKDFRMA